MADSRSPRPQAPHRGADGPEWRLLSAQIEGCARCPLHEGRTHVVIYRGGPHPAVLFVGEAPGKDEDREGRPFVGRAGRALDRAIASVGLEPASIGIVNLLKCRPPENRFDGSAAETCRPYLERQLELLRPLRIVTLGRHALRSFVPSAPPITAAAGFVQYGPRGAVFPLLHPAAPMHAPKYAARWEHDLVALRAWLALPLTQTS